MDMVAIVDEADIRYSSNRIPYLHIHFKYNVDITKGEYIVGPWSFQIPAYPLSTLLVDSVLKALGVSRLSDALGRMCFVTIYNSRVYKIEPLFKEMGIDLTFDKEFTKDLGHKLDLDVGEFYIQPKTVSSNKDKKITINL